MRSHDPWLGVPGIDVDRYARVKPHTCGGPAERGDVPGPKLRRSVCEEFGDHRRRMCRRSPTLMVLPGRGGDAIHARHRRPVVSLAGLTSLYLTYGQVSVLVTVDGGQNLVRSDAVSGWPLPGTGLGFSGPRAGGCRCRRRVARARPIRAQDLRVGIAAVSGPCTHERTRNVHKHLTSARGPNHARHRRMKINGFSECRRGAPPRGGGLRTGSPA